MRRGLFKRVLSKALCVVLFLVLTTGSVVWLWTECADTPAERAARARCCALCHGNEWQQQLHPTLRSHRPGSPISPALRQALIQSHPILSAGAEQELTDWLSTQQLPLLAAANREQAGAALYRAKCAACHGRHGEGLPGQFPPLLGSEWLTAEPTRLPEILTYGLKGPITVQGQEWNSTMLPPGVTSPQEQEDIIQYIRQHFSR